MKYLITICAFCLMFSISACSDNDDNGNDIPSVGNIKMKLDGSNWEASANSISMTIQGAQQIAVGGSKVVNLQNNEFDIVTVTFVGTGGVTTGDYAHDSSLDSYVQVTFSKGQATIENTWFSVSAEATVTSVSSDNIQGSFSATLERDNHPNIVITDGVFNSPIMATR